MYQNDHGMNPRKLEHRVKTVNLNNSVQVTFIHNHVFTAPDQNKFMQCNKSQEAKVNLLSVLAQFHFHRILLSHSFAHCWGDWSLLHIFAAICCWGLTDMYSKFERIPFKFCFNIQISHSTSQTKSAREERINFHHKIPLQSLPHETLPTILPVKT